MKTTKSKPNIFTYHDFRDYLKDYAEMAKKHDAQSFSLRAFSLRAGFKSPNFFKLVQDGDRNLTKESLPLFVKGLNLTKAEGEYFTHLVNYTQAKTADEKTLALKRMMRSRQISAIKPLLNDQLDYFSSWHHPVVRELITHPLIKGDPKKVAELIFPKISLEDVIKSVELLKRLQFITLTDEETYVTSTSLLTSGQECPAEVMLHYHKKLLHMIADNFENITAENRDISALTLGVSLKLIPEIKARVQNFRREILKLVADQNIADEVLTLNIQLLPLTTRTVVKKGKK